MTKAVRVHKVGGPEALVYEDVDVPAPGPGEVRIRQHAVGLNFIDVYFRTGLYKAPGLPFIAGNEAAGEVVAVGPGVTNFHPGDRVAYYFNLGGYASERVIPADKLVKLPDHITYEQGAVLMLKGLTVWYLLHKTFKVEPGHRVLIHAAAGGIGLLACQWAKALGAHVIGTVGSKAKADLALSNGCDHVILYNEEDFVARVKQISRNELCDVVYDGVGKTTFPGSLSCLRPRGLFVSFGNASGPVPPFALAELNNHGSLFATRPKLNDYVSTRKELLEGADTLFAAVINGKLHVPINHAYALKDAAKAHTELESQGDDRRRRSAEFIVRHRPVADCAYSMTAHDGAVVVDGSYCRCGADGARMPYVPPHIHAQASLWRCWSLRGRRRDEPSGLLASEPSSFDSVGEARSAAQRCRGRRRTQYRSRSARLLPPRAPRGRRCACTRRSRRGNRSSAKSPRA